MASTRERVRTDRIRAANGSATPKPKPSASSPKDQRLGWTQADLLPRLKADPFKMDMANRLRQETTLSVKWIAHRLDLGTQKSARLQRFNRQTRKTANNGAILYLTLFLALHIAWSIRAVHLEAAIELYGTPEHDRSDNGPEFIAYAPRLAPKKSD
jgi:hypothetical protein